MDHIEDRTTGSRATLVTVAFNAPELIAIQVDALKRNFSDPYVHVVVDNSSRDKSRQELRSLCARTGTEYVPLPPSHATTGSQSHGFALNWATTNGLKRSQSEYFGILDPDTFPIAPCSYAAVVQEQESYGHFQRAGGHRFYWPDLMFFNRKFLSLGAYDFQPRWLGHHYRDTGAGNCTKIYRTMDLDVLRTMTIEDFHSNDPERPYIKTSQPLAFQAEAITLLDDLGFTSSMARTGRGTRNMRRSSMSCTTSSKHGTTGVALTSEPDRSIIGRHSAVAVKSPRCPHSLASKARS